MKSHQLLMLESHQVAKLFGSVRTGLRLSMRMAAGAIVALAGSRGSGKSNLLRIMFGLIHPDQGDIRVDRYVLGADKV